jgi:hypothetical protein
MREVNLNAHYTPSLCWRLDTGVMKTNFWSLQRKNQMNKTKKKLFQQLVLQVDSQENTRRHLELVIY